MAPRKRGTGNPEASSTKRARSGEWTCGACTLRNGARRQKCQVCGARRESCAEARRGQVARRKSLSAGAAEAEVVDLSSQEEEEVDEAPTSSRELGEARRDVGAPIVSLGATVAGDERLLIVVATEQFVEVLAASRGCDAVVAPPVVTRTQRVEDDAILAATATAFSASLGRGVVVAATRRGRVLAFSFEPSELICDEQLVGCPDRLERASLWTGAEGSTTCVANGAMLWRLDRLAGPERLSCPLAKDVSAIEARYCDGDSTSTTKGWTVALVERLDAAAAPELHVWDAAPMSRSSDDRESRAAPRPPIFVIPLPLAGAFVSLDYHSRAAGGDDEQDFGGRPLAVLAACDGQIPDADAIMVHKPRVLAVRCSEDSKLARCSLLRYAEWTHRPTTPRATSCGRGVLQLNEDSSSLLLYDLGHDRCAKFSLGGGHGRSPHEDEHKPRGNTGAAHVAAACFHDASVIAHVDSGDLSTLRIATIETL